MTMRTLSLAVTALLLATSCRTSSPLIGAPPSAPQHAPAPTADEPVGFSVAAPEEVWENSIAVSPANPLNAVVAGMYHQGQKTYVVRTYYTEDGGVSWHPSAAPPLVTAKAAYDAQGDPVVAFDRSGNAYLVTLIKRGSNYERSGIAVWRSSDGGRTWSNARPVVERQLNYFDDKEWIGIDNTGGPYDGTIYVAWLRSASRFSGPIELVFSRSIDGGLTWTPEKVIGSGGGPQFGIGPNGEIHITYAEGLMMKSVISRDGGLTFTDRVDIGRIAVPPNNLAHLDFFLYAFPSSAADASFSPYRGNVYSTWAGSANAFPNAGSALPGTIWFSRSTDGGRSWSAPIALSNPSTGRDAMFPSLAVDQVSGDIVVAWLDRSDDPQNRLARIYAVRSRDGGATFSAPRAFTSPVSLSGISFAGHYNGTAAHGGVWLTAFSDAAGRLGVARLAFEGPPSPSGPRRRSVRH